MPGNPRGRFFGAAAVNGMTTRPHGSVARPMKLAGDAAGTTQRCREAKGNQYSGSTSLPPHRQGPMVPPPRAHLWEERVLLWSSSK
jgi:hypothetical protein